MPEWLYSIGRVPKLKYSTCSKAMVHHDLHSQELPEESQAMMDKARAIITPQQAQDSTVAERLQKCLFH